MTTLRCRCGASPEPEENGIGEYVEPDGSDAYICYSCWCVEAYGFSVESVIVQPDARAQ